jgi:glycosyltransferase involved in cell wall biosynthesis
VDSGSTDGTLNILTAFPNLRVFKRRFDTHAKQWQYAVEETQIATDWILRLDADYQVSDALVSELARLDPNAPVNAYRIGFDYAISHRTCFRPSIPPIRSCCERISSLGGTGDTPKRGTWRGPLRRSAAGSFTTIGSRPSNG